MRYHANDKDASAFLPETNFFRYEEKLGYTTIRVFDGNLCIAKLKYIKDEYFVEFTEINEYQFNWLELHEIARMLNYYNVHNNNQTNSQR